MTTSGLRSDPMARVDERRIDDYAKDGGKELFTKMHCVRIENP